MREVIADSIHQRERLDGVSITELVGMLKAESVTLLDVRPAEEFALGHLPGALNIPAEELERRLGDLPADAEIVAYCRGPYCVLSSEAVTALRARGMQAADWRPASRNGRPPACGWSRPTRTCTA